MQIKEKWYPTKFEQHKAGWRSSRSTVGLSSRLFADLLAAAYEMALRKHASGRLIDLGCGNAPLTGIYREYCDEFVWADWPNSLHQLFELDMGIDLNEELPFPPDSFDTILLTDVLEHIAEPDSLFNELNRIISPGGYIIIGVPFLYWIHEEPHDHHRFTRFKLADFVKNSSLEVEYIEVIGGGIDTWADITSKFLGLAWKPLAGLIYFPWVFLRSFGLFRRLNKRSAEKFPLAYLAVYKSAKR